MGNKVTTLFEDAAKTTALFPRTKISAISDDDGGSLDVILAELDSAVNGLATVATTGSYNDLINKPTSKSAVSGGTDVSLVTTGEKYTWNNKQAALVSGTNIKTVNSTSLLGSGNISVSGQFYGINTSNVIAVNPSMPYTATQDCLVRMDRNGGYSLQVIIDGQEYWHYDGGYPTLNDLIPLKKGSTYYKNGDSTVKVRIWGIK